MDRQAFIFAHSLIQLADSLDLILERKLSDGPQVTTG
jgi:hypothetical protein